ncbi:MAG: MarR family winged helix-turn-helix transcriptional regulator [Corynebacterium sp.]|nr:MarR family winged helix-turn-helix transcriptional regulator [Corynebacterium sp.]
MDQQPRWLDDEEKQAFYTLMALIIGVDGSLDRNLLKEAGLSHFAYTVLARLSEAPGRSLRMSELASTANGSLSRLSQVVSKLEKQGWVVRGTDPYDGRCTVATLTDAGYDKVVATAPAHVEHVREVLIDPLSRTQLKQLTVVGQRILRALGADNPNLT